MKSMKKRTFTPEQKAKIVLELLKENKTIAELAAEYEIHPNQLQRWKSEATEKMHLIFTKDSDEVAKLQRKHESEVDDLTKQIGQLSIEVNWLKKKSGLK
jgi:transposase-like protein